MNTGTVGMCSWVRVSDGRDFRRGFPISLSTGTNSAQPQEITRVSSPLSRCAHARPPPLAAARLARCWWRWAWRRGRRASWCSRSSTKMAPRPPASTHLRTTAFSPLAPPLSPRVLRTRMARRLRRRRRTHLQRAGVPPWRRWRRGLSRLAPAQSRWAAATAPSHTRHSVRVATLARRRWEGARRRGGGAAHWRSARRSRRRSCWFKVARAHFEPTFAPLSTRLLRLPS